MCVSLLCSPTASPAAARAARATRTAGGGRAGSAARWVSLFGRRERPARWSGWRGGRVDDEDGHCVTTDVAACVSCEGQAVNSRRRAGWLAFLSALQRNSMPAHARVYWHGPGNPLGKLHAPASASSSGTAGTSVPARRHTACLLVVVAARRRLPDLRPGPARPTAAARVHRQQMSLARLLAASRIDPPSCAGDDLAALDALPGPRVYVKHRRGVKGQSVRPLARDAALHWLSEQSPAQRANFVVQAEVPPALLPDGRRFVLRSHVLVIARARAAVRVRAPRRRGAAARGARLRRNPGVARLAGRPRPPAADAARRRWRRAPCRVCVGAAAFARLRAAARRRRRAAAAAGRAARRGHRCTRCSASTSWSIAAAASCCSRRIRTRRSPTARWPRCRGRCTTTWAVCSASSCCRTSRIARPTPAAGARGRVGGIARSGPKRSPLVDGWCGLPRTLT